ncbi:MAG: indolepyruvate ferredoxin oxidoreductase subunit alpha [Sulfolobales archaeon]
MVNVLKAPAGVKLALMGNEAIARGLVEAGASVVTGYPGTPSSEVIMTLHEFGAGSEVYVEWAVNERVAFEVAYGASIGGARAAVTMKAPGASVALDPIVSSAYGGVEGGLMVLVADDPGPHTTQTEQDNRWLGFLAKLPLVSPSSPQEAKDLTVSSFDLSERIKLPVILRTTTRVNHSIGEVRLGPIRPPKKASLFKKDIPRFVRAGMLWNLERHKWLNKQLAAVEEVFERVSTVPNTVEGSSELCIVTEGSAYNYVAEAVSELGADVRVVKLTLLYPIPKKFLSKALDRCDKVLVVEELDPYLELVVKSLLAELDARVTVYGKSTGHLPLEGELNRKSVHNAVLTTLLASKVAVSTQSHSVAHQDVRIAPRPPPMCPGCPHRNMYIALLMGIARAGYRRDEVPVFGDIGCYALGVQPPLEAIWTEHSMGASISMAMGLKVAGYDKPVVAVIGDSTFYHAGVQSLVEAVHKQVDVLVVIADNSVVAMTGHQSTPAWSELESGRRSRPVPIESIIRAIGVDYVEVVDPYDIDSSIATFETLLKKPGVKVVISRHPCALMEARLRGVYRRYRVVSDRCVGCLACIRVTGCPAMFFDGSKVKIVEEDCLGCGLCARFCPYKAIEVVKLG